jgi:transposase, IS5 family
MNQSTNELHSSPEPFEENTKFRIDQNNRWVILSKIIPWSEIEEENTTLLEEKKGRPATPFRITLGCLLIQHILNISDRETVAQIKENPYLQYFIGFESYEYKEPIDASTLVHFRKRISPEIVKKINQKIIKENLENQENAKKKQKKKKM